MIQHYLIAVSNDQNSTTITAIATKKNLAQLKIRCLESMQDFVDVESTVTIKVAKTDSLPAPGIDLNIVTSIVNVKPEPEEEDDGVKVVDLD